MQDGRPRAIIYTIKQELEKRLRERYSIPVEDHKKRGGVHKDTGNSLYYDITQVIKTETLFAFVEYVLIEYVDEHNSVALGVFLGDDLSHEFIYESEISNNSTYGSSSDKMVCRSGTKMEIIDLNLCVLPDDYGIIEKIYSTAGSYYDN